MLLHRLTRRRTRIARGNFLPWLLCCTLQRIKSSCTTRYDIYLIYRIWFLKHLNFWLSYVCKWVLLSTQDSSTVSFSTPAFYINSDCCSFTYNCSQMFNYKITQKSCTVSYVFTIMEVTFTHLVYDLILKIVEPSPGKSLLLPPGGR